MRDNNYKYGRYLNTNQETRWATPEEIRCSSSKINLSDATYGAAGLPLLTNGNEAYVDDSDTHTLIFGATGSKKTRLFCMPLLNILARKGESFVATDPKGELYKRTASEMEKNGYRIVVLDFRSIGQGDMWNPLAIPYELYHSGQRDEAVSMLNDLVTTVSAPIYQNSKDLFWAEMASSFALANLLLLLECGKKEEVNMASLARMCAIDNEEMMMDLSRRISSETIAGMNFNGVFAAGEKTRQSIYATLFGMIRIFNTQRNLTTMLSGNTVDIRSFGYEKTAVYVIAPDEKTTYHFLVTTFLKQVYEVMIAEAQSCENMKLPIRVNFLLDEFCNLPKIPDMPSMISASRSRNMRFFLIAQSLHQLQGKYGEDAHTIKGNCDNWVFLASRELALLNEISELCGTLYNHENQQRRLISVSELQRLSKERGEALIIHERQYPIITEITDIDDYEAFKDYYDVPIKAFELPRVSVFSVHRLLDDVVERKRPIPFT